MFKTIDKTTGGMVLLVATLITLSQAASPQLINYQGRLTNASDVPQNGSFSILFTIWSDPVGGSNLWNETQSITASNGLFSVALGSSTNLPATVFADTTVYLGIKVGADPELTPRTRLIANPYSRHVETVDGSTGGAISGNITLEASTTTAGNIYKGSDLFIHNFGTANTFVGRNAGNLSMSGIDNTAYGAGTLGSNITGNTNTAIGTNVLHLNTTGNGNSAIGRNALYSNISGITNTAAGYSALSDNTAGNDNTAIGSYALTSNTTGESNTANGYQALRNNQTGDNNTASGRNALYLNVVGSHNCAFGDSTLYRNIFGSNNTAIGFGADVNSNNLTNATAIGANAVVDVSNKIRLGNSAVTVIEGQVAYSFTSDKNQKENFEPVDGDDVLRKIRSLSLTSWNYKGQDPGQFRHYGPVAQEFFAAFGHDTKGISGTPTTINSGDMAGILMIAVQALEMRTDEMAAMKAENAELKTRFETTIAALQKEMAELKKQLKETMHD